MADLVKWFEIVTQYVGEHDRWAFKDVDLHRAHDQIARLENGLGPQDMDSNSNGGSTD